MSREADDAPRTVVVTGASSGIGRAVVEAQLRAGQRVIAMARSLRGLPAASARFVGVGIDLADLDRLPNHLDEIVRDHPEVSALVCCAGAGRFGSLEEFSYDGIRSLVELNLTSQIYVVRAFVPLLKRQRRGDIVLIGSEAALAGGRRGAVYAATKFGLRGLAQSLRQECATAGVRVCIVNPGMVRTPFFSQLDFAPGEQAANYIEASDVAEVVASVLQARPQTVIDEINLSPLKKVVRRKPKSPDSS